MGASMGLESQEAKAVDLIHEEDRPKVQAAIADALANKADYHCEFRVHGGLVGSPPMPVLPSTRTEIRPDWLVSVGTSRTE